MPRRRADDCACALLSARTPPTRHRAASAASRLESRRSRSAADWERRLSAGFACRGLDAPGARSAAREPGGCPCRAAGRTTAHVPSDRPRRRRRGIEPRRRRAGWKAGDPGSRGLGAPAFSRLRVPGARCPRRAICGAGAGRLPMPRRRADDRACALLSAQTPPTRHRAASAPSRLESRRSRSAADWERRLSAGFACRGLDAPGARSAAREPGGWPCRAAGRTTAHVPSDRPRRRRRGIEPRRRRAGWKAGDPGQPRTGSAGFQPASRAGGSMPPARDLRRGSRAVAHAAPPGGRPRMCPLIGPDAADAASSRVGGEPAGKPAIPVAADWERRLSAGFACRGLDAPGARSAAREPGGCPCRAAGRTTAHVPSDQPRRRRRGVEPRRRRAGWKAGDPGQPRTGSAGFQPASRAGGSMPPARDLRRGSRAVAHGAPPGGGPRMCPLISPDAADAASSRVGAEPAGKPAIPVSRGLGAPAFSRLRVPGARCPRRAICGAGAGRLPMPRRWADDCACAL
jgi:hypothetical protein